MSRSGPGSILASPSLPARAGQDAPETEPGVDAGALERRSVGRRKLTVEVSPDLHRRILSICSVRRVPVNQAVREVLEKAFPG